MKEEGGNTLYMYMTCGRPGAHDCIDMLLSRQRTDHQTRSDKEETERVG